MATLPAFRLRLPCIPYVPAIEGSLVSSCSVHPPPGPCFVPPVPPPPPPSFGCYEIEVQATTGNKGTKFGLSAEVSYPNRGETGICQPLITINLNQPKGSDGGPQPTPTPTPSDSLSSSSSGEGPPGPPGTPGRTEFSVLVDIVCEIDTCEIEKFYKNLEYDDETFIVYWIPKDGDYGDG